MNLDDFPNRHVDEDRSKSIITLDELLLLRVHLCGWKFKLVLNMEEFIHDEISKKYLL